MKSIILLFAISLFFTQCKKNDKTSEVISVFQFSANAKTYQWNGYPDNSSYMYGAEIDKETVNSISYYRLRASMDEGNSFNTVSFILTTANTLSTGTYTSTNNSFLYTSSMGLNNDSFFASSTGDFTQVNITKIENGLASGTFSGKMTRLGGASSIDISAGIFTNAKIEN